MKGKKIKKKTWLKIFAVVAVVFTISGVTSILAMPDETNAVHIDAFQVEDSTLIIGSHLIYLGSMNDSIYEIASESAKEYNQHNIYYKSEMAGGTWYEISDASALADITTEGVVVDRSEIESLWLTHHTRPDGITYNLKTYETVSIFDIHNPYDLEGMTELEPIKIQYDLLQQTEDKSDTNKRDILYIEEVYNKNRENDATRSLDQCLKDVQLYYEHLVQTGADVEWKDVVTDVMERIDASRRITVLIPLNETELQKMNEVVGREFVYIQGEVTGDFLMSEDRNKRVQEAVEVERAKIQAEIEAAKAEIETLKLKIDTELGDMYAEELRTKEEALAALEANVSARIEAAEKAASETIMNEKRESIDGFILNSDLVDAIGEAMNNVQESYINYSAKMLEEGTTVLSKTEYRLIQELMRAANVKDYNLCNEIVIKLLYLTRINENTTLDESLEKGFITTDLLPEAEEAYANALGTGESEEYKMLSSMASAATKANVLKKQMNETEVVRNELQFILQALTDRMSPEEASAYMEERLGNTDALRSVIKEDAYAPYAESSINQHLDWVSKMLGSIESAAGNGEMDNLMNQKAELQTELMTALDKNQLDEAKKIEAEVKALDQAIDDLEEQLNDIIHSDQASDAEKAIAAAQLSAGSSLKAVQDMKDRALEEIRAGNLNGVENVMDGIGALAQTQPQGALDALKEVYQELVNQDLLNGGASSADLNDLMSKVEDITTEQMHNFIGALSEDDFVNLIKDFIEENKSTAGANGNGSGSSGNGSGSGTGGNGSGAGGNGSGAGGNGSGESGNGQGGFDTGVGDLMDSNNSLGKLDSMEEVMNALSNQDAAMILAGFGTYADQTGSTIAKDILETYGTVAQNTGNPYVFEAYSGDLTYEYVPTDKLARITGYRYIFNDSQKEAILQRGSQYYRFTAFSNLMQKGKNQIEMTRAAGYETVIYISKDIAEEQFALTAQMLDDISYGIILNEQMQNQANAFADYLLEAGGGF